MFSIRPVPTSPGFDFTYIPLSGLIIYTFLNVTFLTQLQFDWGGTLPIVIPTPSITLQFYTKKSLVQSAYPCGFATTTSS